MFCCIKHMESNFAHSTIFYVHFDTIILFIWHRELFFIFLLAFGIIVSFSFFLKKINIFLNFSMFQDPLEWKTGYIDRQVSPPSVYISCEEFWNWKLLFLGRFDGRALLDFIRDSESRPFRAREKTEEEEELEEFVNFERYRDLIKHQRRGCRYFFDFYYYLLLFCSILFCRYFTHFVQ